MLTSVTGPESGSLVSHCFVRCPAPNLLNASQMMICTLHQDNILRLWNIDDGRCISCSNPKMFNTNVVKIKPIRGFPGHVFGFGDVNQIWVVNVYTMQIVSHLPCQFDGLAKSKYDPITSTLELCDSTGFIREYTNTWAKQNQQYQIDEYTSDAWPKRLSQQELLHLTKSHS